MPHKQRKRTPRMMRKLLGVCFVAVGCLVWKNINTMRFQPEDYSWIPALGTDQDVSRNLRHEGQLLASKQQKQDVDQSLQDSLPPQKKKEQPAKEFAPKRKQQKQGHDVATKRSGPKKKEVTVKEFIAASEPQLECIPRPRHIQEKVDQRRKDGRTLIYYHEGPTAGRHARFINWYFPKGNTTAFKSYNKKCDTTTDETKAMEADVVVVLYRKKIEYWKSNKRQRVPPKYCGQLFVMVQTECSNNIDPNLTPKEKYLESKVFDISSTFRLDSDLPRPYKTNVSSLLLNEVQKKYVPLAKRDSEHPATWIASRCDTSNERMGYVEELMKHVNIKNYGLCLKNADMAVSRAGDNWKDAADAQIGRHKFYLAFENSNCDYYVTEKLYRALAIGVIPVVMGAPQAHLYLPNNHSALFVRDFDSPQALAKRMNEINENDALFRYYASHVFKPEKNIDPQFKQQWFQKELPQACKLCDLVSQHFNTENGPKPKFKGVPYEHWESCEQVHGTWRTNFQPIKTDDGIVPVLEITGH